MSEVKLKRLTNNLKLLREDYVVKKSEKEKAEKTLKKDYKIKNVDEALERLKKIEVDIKKLKEKRDSYIERAEKLLDEYEED